MAAWGAFVARITGQESFDVEFLPLKNEKDSDFDPCLFSPYLPFRFDIEPQESFLSILEKTSLQIEERVRRPLFHRDLVERDPVLRSNDQVKSLQKLPLGVCQVSALKEQMNFDYECLLLIPEIGNELELVFSSREINGQNADNMLRRFGDFLSNVVSHPEERIDCIRLLRAEEAFDLIKLGRGDSQEVPMDLTIHKLFEERVEIDATAIAIVHEGRTITYGELNVQSNDLANRLMATGVKPDTLVGLSIDRSIEMIVGILGILKAGCAYLPLDPHYPIDRLSYIINDSDISVLVTAERILLQPGIEGVQILFADSVGNDVILAGSENPRAGVSGKDLAYVIYTSGSSGHPKGVQIEQRSLVNYVLSANRYYNLSSADRILQFSNLNFDASGEEIFCALTTGATLVLRNDEMLSSTALFVNYCEDWGISFLSLPTAYWHTWVSAIESGENIVPSCLKSVIIGGESVDAKMLNVWQKSVGNKIRLINSYGPTEATICATWCDLTNLTIEAFQSQLPIGKPIDNVQTYVVDPQLNILPSGFVGELCIGGMGLARDYLNLPELTDTRFVHNSIVSTDESLLYKTGDKVCWNQDGNLIYFGRADRQVKIRGYRIEPAEVEAAISDHGEIKGCVVSVSEFNIGDKRLSAFVVLKNPESVPPIQELKDFIRNKVPAYMIPAAFTFIDSLPITSNGKIDREALTGLKNHSSELDQELVIPKTDTEETVHQFWLDILQVNQIGTNENIFEVGGHSIHAGQIITRVRQALRKEVSLRKFFENPTIVELAAFIDTLEKTVGSNSSTRVKSVINGNTSIHSI